MHDEYDTALAAIDSTAILLYAAQGTYAELRYLKAQHMAEVRSAGQI